MTDPQALRARMRTDLTAAMKARDKNAVAALRTGLAAIDNAEAVAAPEPSGPPATSEHVAGTVVGLGAAEVARRALTLDDVHAILAGQVTEWTAEADRYESLGRPDEAARLRRESDLLRAYLPG